MPSIINRAGVVPEFAEESGGDLPEPTDNPVETKSAEPVKTDDPKADGTGGELPIGKI